MFSLIRVRLKFFHP